MLSIIMPVYNKKEHLRSAVESVLVQTYTDLELLLINDGSTDGSGRLCDELAAENPRIRVIHKENGGVASARNAGLDAARGDYIGWVDGDDLIAPDMYRVMMALAQQHNADIVQCSHVREPEMLALEIPDRLPGLEVLGPIDSLKRMYRSHYTNALSLCTKLLKKNLFENLRFTEGTAFEDDEVVPKLFEQSKKSVFIELPLYCYVKRDGSIITAPSVKNILALSRHLNDRMVRFRELDGELYELSRRNFYGYLKGKVWEEAFRGTEVQSDAIARLKKHRKAFFQIAHPYDKLAIFLLYLPGGKNRVVKTEFEPVQSIIRIFRK